MTEETQPANDAEFDYATALKVVEARKRSSSILRFLMSQLESYRQKRKMGWSRPQNKEGLRVFETYELSNSADAILLADVFATTWAEFPELTPAQRAFLTDLQHDGGLMAYVFVHDRSLGERCYEGVTFSLGRRLREPKSGRDRFDLVLESEIRKGRSLGPSLARAFVDPFDGGRRNQTVLDHSGALSTAAEALFVRGAELHVSWSSTGTRVWRHWTHDLIDYFGPRQWSVRDTYFGSASRARSA